jgi:hypothetical protein
MVSMFRRNFLSLSSVSTLKIGAAGSSEILVHFGITSMKPGRSLSKPFAVHHSSIILQLGTMQGVSSRLYIIKSRYCYWSHSDWKKNCIHRVKFSTITYKLLGEMVDAIWERGFQTRAACPVGIRTSDNKDANVLQHDEVALNINRNATQYMNQHLAYRWIRHESSAELATAITGPQTPLNS